MEEHNDVEYDSTDEMGQRGNSGMTTNRVHRRTLFTRGIAGGIGNRVSNRCIFEDIDGSE